MTGTSRGARSWSKSSVACTIGWAWKRSRMRPSSSTLANATTVIPWWCAMQARITDTRAPSGKRERV
jgi:hypothetical protein